MLAWLPFEHIAYTPLQIYLGKLDRAAALRALATQWLWVIALLRWRIYGGKARHAKSRFMAASMR